MPRLGALDLIPLVYIDLMMEADIAFGNQISEATLRRSRRRRSRRRRVAAAAALPDITFS